VNSIIRNATRLLRGLFIFRISIALLAGLLASIRWSHARPVEALEIPAHAGWLLLPWLGAVLFLFFPGLERRMGRRYLPVALAGALLAFGVEFAYAHVSPGIQVMVTLSSGRQLSLYWAPTEAILLALVPAVLAGAVYGLRGAIKAAAFATIVTFGLGVALSLSGERLAGFMPLLPLRVAVLGGFPLITGYLADTWRREHAAVEEANRRLRGYAATVEQLAGSRERVRLARDMHDTLAHTLAALVVQLEAVDALQEAGPDPVAARVQLAKVRKQARAGLNEARRAILNLRSSPVDDVGLAEGLERLVKAFGRRSGMAAGFEVEGEPVPLPVAPRHALYRTAEEALENVERHAGAGRVSVCLSYGDGVSLRVQDDGRGFDPAGVEPDRVGLTGIRERAALAGGRVTVETGPGGGTTLVVHIDSLASR
jgi:signal transduction histidine kinase